MGYRNVTVRRLAEELGFTQHAMTVYLSKKNVGVIIGGWRMLTEEEADTVRRSLADRAKLPTKDDVTADLGQPVYTVQEVATVLQLDKDTVAGYGHRLGALIQIRNGIMPSYVISGEGMSQIFEARQETIQRQHDRMSVQSHRAAKASVRSVQHRALMREERDYYTGKVRCFTMTPTASEDPELSSETGPQTCTLQWTPFLPNDDLAEVDTSVWNATNARKTVSLESMRNPRTGEYFFRSNGKQVPI